ncbi:hypothetical protein LNQ82_02460 [Conchiformibius steedae DSM 2580]|uniref:Uncharacterized protein n=2 Tax=Conchiformibius steedae TaxID=153493 RepID=A0AAE9HY51_9NEIS|nr:hypothetical protein [Conchiformibius steedae]QMT33393.1 hypothetical protein H3L98_09985 [Conchiformibius steedae]URD68045.1 hypothetical protein LNQ82_02460 [Conchiformibius steedae DSM 2580]
MFVEKTLLMALEKCSLPPILQTSQMQQRFISDKKQLKTAACIPIIQTSVFKFSGAKHYGKSHRY